ncbi:MAG: hypothetical protein KOO60_03290 [Gemmatimonadales bacterium]|nr:hypothetical protein [Gemmatimonadales bacterium]
MFHRSKISLCVFLLAGLLWSAPGGTAVAQDLSGLDWNQTEDTLASAAGLHYGHMGGQGLAFNVPLKWYLYLQGSGGIWHGNDDKRHNLGASLHYILRQDQRIRLYLTSGLGYFYHSEVLVGGDWETEKNWNSGAGIGIEYLQGKRWSWQFDLAFVREGEDGDIKLFPQVGLFYYW